MFRRWHGVVSQIGSVGRRGPTVDLTVHKDCVGSQSGSTQTRFSFVCAINPLMNQSLAAV